MSYELLVPPSIGSTRVAERVRLLSHALTVSLGAEVELAVASSYEELLERARSGDVSMVWAPPSVCAQLEARDVRALFRCIREGHDDYRSALVVRRGEEHGGLESLRGRRAVWVDPMSLGGRLLALSLLREHGYDPATMFREETIAGSYPRGIRAVVHGKADVTAVTVTGNALERVSDSLCMYAGGGHAERLVGLALSRATPNDALLFTGKLSASGVEALSERLFGAAPNGPAAWRALFDAEGFAPGRLDDYRQVGELLRR